MICPSCGCLVPDDDFRCRNCGKEIGSRIDRIDTQTKLGETHVEELITPTRIYSGKDASRTLLYSPDLEKRKPILGWLVAIEGKDQWKEFRLYKEETQLLIGTSEECMICLEDERLEARHASLRVKDEKLFLTDLDSSSGTYVNGEGITKVEIKDSDDIKLGETVLRFRRF